ncbi:MAG: sigma-70 family RNA polymerase sigma factor [Planctomycetes bacterium]|nr:sigma-70 family RNA polymerase sigma factor [Planctomycetota bacterium]
MDANPHLEDLLLHAAWARRLARTLVADPNTADDLVQDAYVLAASGAYTRSDAPRGWLATVLRNFARRCHRGESARTAREHQVARAELLPGADDRLERAQLEHALAAAVLALDAPYRDTLLLRYFEGLTSAEIARRHGVPESTVRNRLARALEQLRARLDRERGGREAWMGAFVAAFGSGALVPTAAPAGALPVPSSIAASLGGMLVMQVIFGVVIFAGLGWFAWPSESVVEPHAVDAVVSERVPEERFDASSPDAPNSAEPRVATTATSSQDTPPADTRAVVQGRFVDGAGRPVAGVHVELRATELVQFEVVTRSLTGADVASTSDGDGRFTLRIAPLSTYRFSLGWSASAWFTGDRELGPLEPAGLRDVGTLRLLATASARVRVVAADGHVMGTGWTISAEPREADAQSRILHADVPDAEGVYLLPQLSEGRWSLDAEHAAGVSTKETDFELIGGGPNEITLRYVGDDPATVLTVDVRARFLRFPSLSPDAITLRGPGIEAPHPIAVPQTISQFSFHGLALGDYVVRIDDPRYELFESAPVRPGSSLLARLRGNARVRLHVVDGAGAAWTQPIRVLVRGLEPGSLDHMDRDGIELTVRDQVEGAELTYALPSEPMRLCVQSPGTSPIVFELTDLAPGETRTLVARMTSGTRIAGHAVDSDHTTPLRDASVGLYRPAQREDSPSSAWIALTQGASTSRSDFFRQRIAETRTDDTGAFAFGTVVPGAYFVRVEAGPGRFATSERVTVAQDDARDDVLLVAPTAATLRVSVRTPPDISTDGFFLLLRPTSDRFNRISRAWFLAEGRRLPLPQNAACTFAGLGEGSFELLLTGEHTEEFVNAHYYRLGVRPIVLETLDVHAGEALEREYDLTTSLPGRCDVVVTANGAPRAGRTVIATRNGDFRAQDTVSAATDAEGRARLAPLPTGTWRLHVIGNDVPWVWDVPGTLVIASGERLERAIDVPLVRGTLTVLDANTHQPWPEAPLALELGDERYVTYTPVRVTPAGTVELELAPHSYAFRYAGPDAQMEDPPCRIDWTAAGPAPTTIELRRP